MPASSPPRVVLHGSVVVVKGGVAVDNRDVLPDDVLLPPRGVEAELGLLYCTLMNKTNGSGDDELALAAAVGQEQGARLATTAGRV